MLLNVTVILGLQFLLLIRNLICDAHLSIHWELAHNKLYVIFIIVIIIIFIFIIVIIIITIIICLELFWKAPEFLGEDVDLPFSQPGDVYSYGIILSELLSREMPYFSYNMSPKGRFFIPLYFYQFMISVKFVLVFLFIHYCQIHCQIHRTSVEYFTRTCSDWLTPKVADELFIILMKYFL